jgi:hypothetical protein
VERLWDNLCRVRSLSFVARSGKATGWNGAGHGSVTVRHTGPGMLTFAESGLWQPEGGRPLQFRIVFRWSASGDTVRLEHLRFGEDQPVYLFDLAQSGEGEWRSAPPHACGPDCYAAWLVFRNEVIVLR